MKNIFAILFKISLVLLILSGTFLVIGQVLGVLFQNGDLIISTKEIFSKPTFGLASIVGLLGFILGYFPDEKKTLTENHSLDNKSKNL